LIIKDNDYRAEAELLARYLIGVSPSSNISDLYGKAMALATPDMDHNDLTLWTIAKRHPFTLKFIDAGLAMIKPHSAIRRKIYTMLALLETSPDYCEFFLSRAFHRFYWVKVMVTGVKALFTALIGVAFLKLRRLA